MDDKQFRSMCRTFCDTELILRTELLRRGVTIMPGRSIAEFLAPLTIGEDPSVNVLTKHHAVQEAMTEFRRVKDELALLTGDSSKGANSKATPRRRFPLKNTIVEILGTKTMSTDDIMEGLSKRGWKSTSKDPRASVLDVLANKEVFERAGRGIFQLLKPGKVTLKPGKVAAKPGKGSVSKTKK